MNRKKKKNKDEKHEERIEWPPLDGLADGISAEYERQQKSSYKLETPPQRSVFRRKQHVGVGCEKRRKGKTVTVISGLNPATLNLDAILEQLKSACVADGTIRTGRIEIQGDHRERVLSILKNLGYSTKLRGE